MQIDGASVYILLCADGSYYAGLTRKDVETRVSEHNLGAEDDGTTRSKIRDAERQLQELMISQLSKRSPWCRVKKRCLRFPSNGVARIESP